MFDKYCLWAFSFPVMFTRLNGPQNELRYLYLEYSVFIALNTKKGGTLKYLYLWKTHLVFPERNISSLKSLQTSFHDVLK